MPRTTRDDRASFEERLRLNEKAIVSLCDGYVVCIGENKDEISSIKYNPKEWCHIYYGNALKTKG